MLRSTVYIHGLAKLLEGKRKREKEIEGDGEAHGIVWKSLENARAVHR